MQYKTVKVTQCFCLQQQLNLFMMVLLFIQFIYEIHKNILSYTYALCIMYL